MIVEKTQDTESVDKKAAALVKNLLAEVNGALKREKGWREAAHKAVKIYEAGKADENAYNILYRVAYDVEWVQNHSAPCKFFVYLVIQPCAEEHFEECHGDSRKPFILQIPWHIFERKG